MGMHMRISACIRVHESCTCIYETCSFQHHNGNSFIQMLDIKHYACSEQSITDDVKHQLLENREPEKSFKFPPKQYAMKLSKTGCVNRYCSRE